MTALQIFLGKDLRPPLSYKMRIDSMKVCMWLTFVIFTTAATDA